MFSLSVCVRLTALLIIWLLTCKCKCEEAMVHQKTTAHHHIIWIAVLHVAALLMACN